MKKLRLLCLLAGLSTLTSCAISKYTAPPFTDMDKILNLEKGQSMEQVLTTLMIKPYDVVYSHDMGKKILIYNYRVKDRRMVLPTRTADRVTHSEQAQRDGEPWFNTNYRELYVLFQDDKLKSIYGEEALSSTNNIESLEAHLSNSSGKNAEDEFDFARSTYNDRRARKNAILTEDAAANKRRRWVIIGGVVVSAYLITNLIDKL